MSKNLFENLKPVAHLQKNAFDLSFRNVFSAKAGQILPILCEEVVRGDKFRLDCKALIRSQPLNTAAFLRSKAYFHFFFVPSNSLWHNFNSFINQRENNMSSNVKGFSYVPNVSSRYLREQLSGNDFYNIHGQIANDDALKLAEYLGYGNLYFGTNANSKLTISDSKLSILPVLAYNKVYFDYYSNPYYEKPEVLLYNCDCVDASSPATSNIANNPLYTAGDGDDTVIRRMFSLKYRSYKKDLFMGVLPEQQFGSATMVLSPDFRLFAGNDFSSDTPYSDWLRVSHVGDSNGYVGTQKRDSIFFSSPELNIDVLALRKAEALQKWKENTLRAGSRLDDSFKAHFGESGRVNMADHADFIGGFDSSINVDEVIATADGAEELGKIGGKGISALNSPNISYDVPEHGYIMCMFSIVPECDYDAVGVSKSVTRLEPFDYFTPEFENLGLEPVYGHQLFGYTTQAAGTASTIADGTHSVLGYAPRYSDYKTNIDVVHDDFRTKRSLSSWCTPRSDLQRSASAGKLSVRDFKVNPSILDSVFALQAGDDRMSDQFLINSYFNISALRPMSILGLPNY